MKPPAQRFVMWAIMPDRRLRYWLTTFMPVYSVEYLCPGYLGQFLEAFSLGKALLLCHEAFDALQSPAMIPAYGMRQPIP